MKVARKFTLAFLAGILVVLLASVVVRVRREQALFEQDVSRDTRVLGRALGYAVERTWQTRGKDEALELIRYATEQETHLLIDWVWLEDGLQDANRTLSSDLRERLSRGEPVVSFFGSDRESVHTYVPVRVSNDRLGAIEITAPLVEERAYLDKSILHASITALVVIVLCALLAWFLGFTLIGRPMRLLVEHARALGSGDLGRRLSLDTGDEIGELASEMDAMSESLRDARERLGEETRSRIAAIEQLQHADRLATVGTLASGIAHELGTPINVIEGYAQLIREDPTMSPRLRDTATVVDRQCKRMEQIIRQLLDFAREGGPLAGSTDVLEVVEDTLRMVNPLMRKQEVEAKVEDVATDARVGISFHQLQQVLANIVVNALHSMPNGGNLEVRTERRRARPPGNGATDSDYVAISVKDDGSGMDQETAARVFEPFFTTKDVGEGTGLGLSVAYGIIEHHGGWIEVHSERRHGSMFTILLPSEHSP